MTSVGNTRGRTWTTILTTYAVAFGHTATTDPEHPCSETAVSEQSADTAWMMKP